MPCCCCWPFRRKTGKGELKSAKGSYQPKPTFSNGGFVSDDTAETKFGKETEAHEDGKPVKTVETLEMDLKRQKEEFDLVKNKLDRATTLNMELQNRIIHMEKQSKIMKQKLDQKSNYLQSIQQLDFDSENTLHKRRQAVRGEAVTTPDQLQKTEKNAQVKKLLKRAIMRNEILNNLAEDRIDDMVDYMQCALPASSVYINEGTYGDRLYVLESGKVEVTQDSKFLTTLSAGTVFGEIAIMYNVKRTATVKAITATKVWMLQRNVFHYIMKRGADSHRGRLIEVLKKAPLMRKIRSRKRLVEIADALVQETYTKGEYIIRQGELGDTFYVLVEGDVYITSLAKNEETNEEEEQFIRSFGAVNYFGEKALLNSSGKREVNVIAKSAVVKCLSLEKKVFVRHIGQRADKDWDAIDERVPMGRHSNQASRFSNKPSKVQYRRSTDENLLQVGSRKDSAMSVMSVFGDLPAKAQDPRFENVALENIKELGTLGIGGFATVKLVRLPRDPHNSYALKRLNKAEFQGTPQESYHASEIAIMSSIKCPFIVELYRSFESERETCMLLEACLGGELWSKLQMCGRFESNEAKFYAACVIEALDYLHALGIAYRDIKPENLVLDKHGYVKLIDMGLAKKMEFQSERTFSVSGTAAYMAPEVFLHMGHDMSVDYWGLGILIFELLTGSPPFNAKDPAKIHAQVINGIDSIRWPERIRSNVKTLIRRLCHRNPAERLGNSKEGVQEIRNQNWFGGFNWDDLRSWKMKAPKVFYYNDNFDLRNFDDFDETFEETKTKKMKKNKSKDHLS